jgi:hypothetical protein
LILRLGFPGKRQLRTTRPESGQHFADVGRSLDHFFALDVAELCEHKPGRLEVLIVTGPLRIRDYSCGL